MKCDEENSISFVVNSSPVTKYHTLLCPNLEAGLPQCMTLEALRFCVTFLLDLHQRNDWNGLDFTELGGFRIGYNSPGALASVNHLHLHLIYLERVLYVDHVVRFLFLRQFSLYLNFFFTRF